jgi:hypothetical protein
MSKRPTFGSLVAGFLLVATGLALVRGLAPARGGEQRDDARAALASAASSAKIGLAQAIRRAEKDLSGHAVSAEMEVEKGRTEASVLLWVSQGTGRWVVRTIDANSGAILEKEDEDADEHDEEHEKTEGREEAGDRAASHGTSNATKPPGDRRFTDRFDLDPADLGPTGRNPYCILEPGYVLQFESPEDASRKLVVTVLDETKRIAGVVTRVVEELETKGGKEIERSRNYLAISKRTNDVYYFGEESGGGWQAGKDGARAGLFVPATPLLGGRYRMEIAPGTAMDGGEIVAIDERFTCPAGTFERCLRVEETSPLEPGARESKVYARGVGLVYDDGLRLVRHGRR